MSSLFGQLLKQRAGRFTSQNPSIHGTYPAGQMGVAYTYTPTLSGSPTPLTVTSLGALPTGLTLNANTGAITGTPTSSGRWEFNLRVTASDGKSSVRRIWLVVASNNDLLLTGSAPAARQNVAFAGLLPSRNGGTSPFIYDVTVGSLPPGLSLNTSTGSITGTPTGYGNSSCTLRVRDSNNDEATLVLNFTIAQALSLSGTTVPGVQNSVYAGFTPTRSGGTGIVTYSIFSGTLYNGLSLNASTGSITGTSTVSGTMSLVLRATDSDNYTYDLPLTIAFAQESVVGEEKYFGTQLTNGGANWGGNADRAMLDKFLLEEGADVTSLQIWILQGVANTGVNSQLRGLIYTDNGSDAPGSLVAVGTAVQVPDATVASQRLALPITATLTPGYYWLGAVGNNFTYEIGSGAQSGSQAALVGGLSFNSPPTICPIPAGRYDNDVAVYALYNVAAIPDAPPVNTVAPVITGDTTAGALLSCSNGTFTGSPPPAYSYQWKANGVNISGATSNSYLTLQGQIGQTLTCLVTATNSSGSDNEVSNGVVITSVIAPSNTSAPTITGGDTVGSTLTCGVGTWTGTQPITYAYQWKSEGVDISGAVASTYVLRSEDRSTTITCQVTGTNLMGSDTEISNSILVSSSTVITQWFGTQNTTQVSGLSTSANRAILDRMQLTYNAVLKRMYLHTNATAPASATNYRAVVYSDIAGEPGELRAVGSIAPVPQTAGYTTSLFNDETLTPGWYWIGYVADSHTSVIRMAVGVSPNCRLYNGNFSYNSPPSSMAALQVDATYDLTPAMYIEFTTTDEQPNLDEPPVNTIAPVLTGSAVIGNVLTCNVGTWTGIPTPTITHQWYANNVAISGETGTTLTTTGRSAGEVIKCRETATNGLGTAFVETGTRTLLDGVDLTLNIDLAYVDTASPKYTAFQSFVNAARGGNPGYAFRADDAAYMYRITGDESYRTLAINTIEAIVVAAESAIAGGGQPRVAGDSYLDVGQTIGPLAIVYEWCAAGMTTPQRARWAAFADQAVFNVWHHTTAFWGSNQFPWSGWSVNNPGNNYHYSFCTATALWALASDNIELLTWLDDNKFNPLRAYFAGFPGGGSREGTGYGVAFMNLFDLYQVWKDSGQSELALANSHMTDTLYFWIHATVATRNRFFSIGDLAREATPNIFDYHRHLVLRARHLAVDTQARSEASWWLNNISIQNVGQGFERRADLVPPGNNTSTPPTALTYYAQATGNVFTRNSWETNAINVHFLCGIYDESHAGMQQGMFQIFHTNFLSGTANMYSPSGIDQNVEYNNVLRFNTSGGTIINQSNGTATMDVIAGSGGDVTCDMTLKGIIANATVTSWNRFCSFVGSTGTVRVQDDYVTTSGTTATFQVILPTLPSVVGNVITCGELLITVNTPVSPTITVIDLEATTTLNSGYRVDISGGAGSYDVTMQVTSSSNQSSS